MSFMKGMNLKQRFGFMSNMGDSAWERTPVEIWMLILGHAIASPLSPFLEDGTLPYGIVESIDTFTNWCYSSKRLRNTILRLRSVCRTWSNILRDVAMECIFLDVHLDKTAREQVPSKTRRLYIGAPTECLCGQVQNCMFRHSEDSGEDTPIEIDTSTLLDICSPNVKILMLAHGCPQLPLDFLTRLPNISALSLDDFFLPDLQALQKFPSQLIHISHLRL
ncbi:9804_t:CDS:1, partial [Acaulospora colombiana]